MSERLRITDVVRVPLREQGVVGEIEPAWSPASVNRVVRGCGAYRHLFAALADPPEVGAAGCMAVPTAPGLDVSIDPVAVA